MNTLDFTTENIISLSNFRKVVLEYKDEEGHFPEKILVTREQYREYRSLLFIPPTIILNHLSFRSIPLVVKVIMYDIKPSIYKKGILISKRFNLEGKPHIYCGNIKWKG